MGHPGLSGPMTPEAFCQQFQMTWYRRHEDDKSLKWLRSRILSILNKGALIDWTSSA
jgi:hypothetical protein